MKKYKIAVVGAMGAVGTEMLNNLSQRNFPLEEVVALDIAANAGKKVKFGDQELTVRETKIEEFEGVNAALFAVGDAVSKEWAPRVAETGCIVIDNSSAWRMDPEVPLVIPECNPEDLRWHKGIIANPNCSTIIALMAIKPLHDYANVKRITATTFQAVSGAGINGLNELSAQVKDILDGREVEPKVFQHQIAFNIIPHIDYFEENDYTHEEMKMFREGRKILHAPDLMVNCTCARVPVFRSHSESITIETEKELTPEKARELLGVASGVKVYDDPSKNEYPMPVDTSGGDLVWVGRIRKDISAPNSLAFWCAGDQIRKGAAQNAVQIAETLDKMGLL